MQYKYIDCKLPSNGLIYPVTSVQIRPKTIFDIKTLLGNATFDIKSEIDTLQNCINPVSQINVYDLVNQDVVYLLYKLRSLSDDVLTFNYKGNSYDVLISELEVNMLDEWDTEITLPESKQKVILQYVPIGKVFNLYDRKIEFEKKYPDYNGDIINTITILDNILSFGNFTTEEHIRNELEKLSYKDSLYLLNKINELKNKKFGIVEEFNIKDEDGNVIKTLPIEITETFFRPSISD